MEAFRNGEPRRQLARSVSKPIERWQSAESLDHERHDQRPKALLLLCRPHLGSKEKLSA